MAQTPDYSDAEKQAIACVASSDYRRRTLAALADRPGSPSDLAERVGIDIAHVSRALKKLREVEAAELVVPEDTRKGRIHRITDCGQTVLGVVGDE